MTMFPFEWNLLYQYFSEIMFVRFSGGWSVDLSVCLSVCLSSVCLSVCLYVCLSVCLSVSLPWCHSVYLLFCVLFVWKS